MTGPVVINDALYNSTLTFETSGPNQIFLLCSSSPKFLSLKRSINIIYAKVSSFDPYLKLSLFVLAFCTLFLKNHLHVNLKEVKNFITLTFVTKLRVREGLHTKLVALRKRSKPGTSITPNGLDADPNSYAAPFDWLCGLIQSQVPPPWPSLPKPLQMHIVPGRSLSQRAR
jgi:hypothetical protein